MCLLNWHTHTAAKIIKREDVSICGGCVTNALARCAPLNFRQSSYTRYRHAQLLRRWRPKCLNFPVWRRICAFLVNSRCKVCFPQSNAVCRIYIFNPPVLMALRSQVYGLTEVNGICANFAGFSSYPHIEFEHISTNSLF